MSFTVLTKEDIFFILFMFISVLIIKFNYQIILNMSTNRFNIESFGDYPEYWNYTVKTDMFQQTITDFVVFTR